MADAGIEGDPDVRAAPEWFYEIAPDAPALLARIPAAQIFHRARSIPDGVQWPETAGLVLKDDFDREEEELARGRDSQKVANT